MLVRKAAVLTTLAAALCGVLALPTSAAAPMLVPSSTVLSYGQLAVGSTTTLWVTFTNRSSAPAVLGPVAVSWRGPAGFALQSDTCGNEVVELTSGASCRYQVAFSPSAAGSFRARLTYVADGRIAAVELRGRAR
jgi:hypothetical protein